MYVRRQKHSFRHPEPSPAAPGCQDTRQKVLPMNITLIGMPACGKSTIGKKLAKTMNVPFTDMDTYIEEQAGRVFNTIAPPEGVTEEEEFVYKVTDEK